MAAFPLTTRGGALIARPGYEIPESITSARFHMLFPGGATIEANLHKAASFLAMAIEASGHSITARSEGYEPLFSFEPRGPDLSSKPAAD